MTANPERPFPVNTIMVTTRAGRHPLKIKVLLGSRTFAVLGVALERYESEAYKNRSGSRRGSTKTFVPKGAVLIYDRSRKMHLVARGLPEAIEVCRRTTATHHGRETRDLALLESDVEMLFADALLVRASGEPFSQAYAARAGALLERTWALRNSHKVAVRNQVEAALTPYDRLGRRNVPAVLARLSSAAHSLGLRQGEIVEIDGRVDARKAVILSVRSLALRELNAHRRQIMEWRETLSTHWPPKDAEGRDRFIRMGNWMIRLADRMVQISLRPLSHMAFWVESELREIAHLMPDHQASAQVPEAITRRMEAILISLDLQAWGLTDLADLRSLVGTARATGLPPHLFPWEATANALILCRTWVEENASRDAVLRRNPMGKLAGDLDAAVSAHGARDLKALHAALRLAARRI